ncbi:hypothetical protein AB0B97_14945 [Micromonospora sp. NPDC049004]|uniref:hypothetical protein n=1 Tax=Micromonospora sp. NPDC049004 TaxID=3154348 RepID=UPI0033EF4452
MNQKLGQYAADLDRHVGDSEVLRALEAWAQDQSLAVDVPGVPWRRRGGSGALLVRLQITSSRRAAKPTDTLMKVCAQGSPANEPENHERAWLNAPAFAGQHLFMQLFPPVAMKDGRTIMFLESPKAFLDARTLGELPTTLQREAATATIRLVFREWNNPGSLRRITTSARSFIRLELGCTPQEDDAAGTRIGQTGPSYTQSDAADPVIQVGMLPSGLLQRLAGRSHLRARSVEYISGHSHGDLHLDNILVPPTMDPKVTAHDIRLIDLSGYNPSAPLSRDLAALLLSSVLSAVRDGMPDSQSKALTHALLKESPTVTSAADESTSTLTVQAIRAAAVGCLDPFHRQIFHKQYLLSLLSQSLLYTSYSNVGRSGHHWYLNLGARAADAYTEAQPYSK